MSSKDTASLSAHGAPENKGVIIQSEPTPAVPAEKPADTEEPPVVPLLDPDLQGTIDRYVSESATLAGNIKANTESQAIGTLVFLAIEGMDKGKAILETARVTKGQKVSLEYREKLTSERIRVVNAKNGLAGAVASHDAKVNKLLKRKTESLRMYRNSWSRNTFRNYRLSLEQK